MYKQKNKIKLNQVECAFLFKAEIYVLSIAIKHLYSRFPLPLIKE